MSTSHLVAAREAIARIGWRQSPAGEEPVKLEVVSDGIRLHLRVSLPMIDIETGKPGFVFMEEPLLDHYHHLSGDDLDRWENAVARQGLRLIKRVWMHEHDDHVTLDGKLVKDPHAVEAWVHPLDMARPL